MSGGDMFLFVFRDKVSLCSASWLQTHNPMRLPFPFQEYSHVPTRLATRWIFKEKFAATLSCS